MVKLQCYQKLCYDSVWSIFDCRQYIQPTLLLSFSEKEKLCKSKEESKNLYGFAYVNLYIQIHWFDFVYVNSYDPRIHWYDFIYVNSYDLQIHWYDFIVLTGQKKCRQQQYVLSLAALVLGYKLINVSMYHVPVPTFSDIFV